jgi:hypothetical protein
MNGFDCVNLFEGNRTRLCGTKEVYCILIGLQKLFNGLSA